jgi:hypothetical protein
MRDGRLQLVSRRYDGEAPSSKLNTRAIQYTELPRAINPAKKAWKKWKKVGSVQFPVFDGDGDRREYQQISNDAGNPQAWVK